ncbi:Serine acetyltransferase [Thalictrum thalictroides]|uniref:serine O-acetyltransferase n=1 Tax=Thalictrum thalictroides TaxID=46969 RepID=A0A7J6UW25_THATH|nr:Serine acetyltransferase [Thalictrum thalictroides]
MAACVHNSRTDQTTTRSRISLSSDHQSQRTDNSLSKYGFYSSRPSVCNLVSSSPVKSIVVDVVDHPKSIENGAVCDDIWLKMREEAKYDMEQEPLLLNYYFISILSHKSLESALANHLAMKLSNSSLSSNTLYEVFLSIINEDYEIKRAIRDDIKAVKERDPACISLVHCMLNFKGFLACQAHRVAHKLWSQGRNVLALLIQNRVSEVFAVDIHPGAKMGRGILLDHATGVVIGETAVIGNNVSILHNVTLGGTGKTSGDRHPKIGDGVLIGAGTCVLGNVRIGDGAKIGAGSVVLKEVPARTTAVGNPARIMGGKGNPIMLDKIPSETMDHTSHIEEWSDYVI